MDGKTNPRCNDRNCLKYNHFVLANVIFVVGIPGIMKFIFITDKHDFHGFNNETSSL